jgi:hypothetical protein
MSLDPTFTEEAAAKFIERRADTKQPPITNDEQFFGFIQTLGVNTRAIQESKIPLLYGTEYNFRIVSTGIASNVKREITAITYDFVNIADRYAEMLKKQDDENNQNQSNQQNQNNQNNQQNNSQNNGNSNSTDQSKAPKSTKGRPAVVYWEEN